jgi:hypothetical protein
MNRDDDQTWTKLVQSFHSSSGSDGNQPWPAAEEISEDEESNGQHDISVTLGSLTADDRERDVLADDDTLGDHFVPPAPAPLPRPDRVSRMAWIGVIGGPASLIVTALFSWRPPDEILALAVIAFVGGFVTLVARMRGHHPNDPDNGAIV